MKCFVLISASLFFSWISVSESQSQTVDVLPGDDATLLCPNKLPSDCVRFFFRLVPRTTVRCIFALANSGSKPKLCDGYHKDSIEVSTNISMFSLRIKNVSVFDSGMYFCGFYMSGYMNISVIHLSVKGDDQLDKEKLESGDQLNEDSDEKPEVMSVILGSLAVLLTVGMSIITFLISVIKNLDSDDLTYTSVMFSPAARRRRELEPNDVFTATR